MKDSIQEGDIVNIFFNHSDAIWDAKILYTPVATGDCFKVKGDNSIWDCKIVQGNRVIAKNRTTGTQGPIPISTISEIVNMAVSHVEAKDIKIVEKPKLSKSKIKNIKAKLK